jgi:hypothetical protein
VLVLVGIFRGAARLISPADADARGPVAQIHAHGERIPDFAGQPTIANVTNGAWSDPATWNLERVPTDDDIVRIREQSSVVYDVVSDARVDALGVAGALTFRTSGDTRLRVTHLLVYSGGTLTVGDERRPIQPEARAEIVINDRPLLSGTSAAPGIDPFQFGNGLLVWGTLSLHGAGRTPSFERLAEEAHGGDTALVLSAPPHGWQAGDRIFLPDSRLLAHDEIQHVEMTPYNLEGTRGIVVRPRWETAAIVGLDGVRIELDRPLRYAHLGARDEAGSIARGAAGSPLMPHVANITRNVVVRSERPDGVRGHTIAFRDGSVVIANALFQGLGRTTIVPLDSTRSDTSGGVTHVGENQAARYPIHMHHVVDPARAGTSHPFRITGTVVDNARRWGISIHGSHFGLVKDNVVFDVDGAGIVTEDGSETGNRFERNLVAAVRGSGQTADARRLAQGMGHEGAGFWLASDNNAVIDNVAAGVRDGGFTLFRSPGALAFPAFPRRVEGSDPDQPFRAFEFSGNEVYGAAETGVELWDGKECGLCSATDAVLRDTTVWHSRNGVRFDYHADHYRFNGLLVHGDARSLASTHGVMANDSVRAVIHDADIRYVEVGIDGGGHRNRVLEVDNAVVRARVGIRIRRGTSWGARQHATFREVSVTALPGPGAKLVELDQGGAGSRRTRVTLRRPIHFANFKQEPGSDFDLFYPDQAPGHVMPQSTNPVRGCPEAGLTNAQCFKAHHIAIGGELAPCDTRIEGIDGFACAVTQASPTNP